VAAWDVSSRYVLHGIKSLVAALLLFAAAVALTPAKETHAPGLKLAERRKPVGAAHKSAAARPQETERKAASAKPAVALVSGNDVAIREAPRDNARVLGVAVFGTMVDVTTQDGKWAQVRTGGQGAGGWVEKAGLHF
jgi:hypothetical protein